MAKYMNQICNSEEFKNSYSTKYYISTGDNSIESAISIIADYTQNQKGDKVFFRDSLMPRIKSKIASSYIYYYNNDNNIISEKAKAILINLYKNYIATDIEKTKLKKY